jgi:hypothetical protein
MSGYGTPEIVSSGFLSGYLCWFGFVPLLVLCLFRFRPLGRVFPWSLCSPCILVCSLFLLEKVVALIKKFADSKKKKELV